MSGTAIRSNALACKDFTTKTISSGDVIIDATYHVIASEAGVTDDLDTMTPDFTTLSVDGNNFGPMVLLIADAGDTITLKHSAATYGFDLPDDTDYDMGDDIIVLCVLDFANSLWRVIAPGADPSPTIIDFSSAQHDHADAAGGGNTLTIPTIDDFTNATHDHADAAGGGQIDPATALSAAVAIAQGGTGQAAKQAAFDALSPVTTEGDIIYRDDSNNIRLAIGTASQILATNSDATAPEWIDLPNRATHWHDESTVTNGNALAPTVLATQQYATYSYQNASADADAFSFSVCLAAGTYTFYVLGITDANQAIIDWDFDGGDDTIIGQDWYAAAQNLNVIKNGAVTLSVGGNIVVTGTINDNNVASGGFDMKLTKMWFKQAAD